MPDFRNIQIQREKVWHDSAKLKSACGVHIVHLMQCNALFLKEWSIFTAFLGGFRGV